MGAGLQGIISNKRGSESSNGAIFLRRLIRRKGVCMEVYDEMVCKEMLLDLLFYERRCGHLSPEMEYLFERHIEQCPSCRRRVLGFQRTLNEAEIVRNFG